MNRLKKTRVTLMILLSMALVITLMPQAAFAADEAQREKDRAKLEKILGGNTTIPTHFTKDSRYDGANTLIYVDMPDNIIIVGIDAFGENAKLREVIIPASVKAIGVDAFASKQLEVVTFEGKVPVTSGELWTIFGSTKRSGPLTINCPNPEYEAYKNAFKTQISNNQVKLVPVLTKEEIAKNQELLKREEDRVKLEKAINGHLLIMNNFCEKYYVANTLIYVDIPDCIEHIGCYVFDEHTKVREVIIPEGVDSIKEDAFTSKKLEVVTFKGKVPTKGYRELWQIFGERRSNPLTINCPDTEYEAYKSAFKAQIADNRVKLVPIKVVTKKDKEDLKREEDRAAIKKALQGKTRIERYQFKESKFKYVYIPDNIKSIAKDAFWDSDLQEVTIPASVTSIETRAFSLCFQMKSVTFWGEIPELPDEPTEIFSAYNGYTIYCPESEYTAFKRAFSADSHGYGVNSKTKVTVSVIQSSGTRAAPASETYTVTEKPDTWRGNGTAAATIKAPSSELIQITRKGEAVDVDNYKVSDDTVITFTEDYLKTLKADEHTFNVEFLHGAADVTVEKSNMLTYLLWGGIALVVIAGVVAVIVVRKRRRQNSANNQETA